jgi:hypothetical protein
MLIYCKCMTNIVQLQRQPKSRHNLQMSYTGANLDIPRNLKPYFMNSSGIGSAKHEMPPRRLQAGPIPRFVNRGMAAKGRPQANKLRKKVLPAIALAAKGP